MLLLFKNSDYIKTELFHKEILKTPVETRILIKSNMGRNVVETLRRIISEKLIKIKEKT